MWAKPQENMDNDDQLKNHEKRSLQHAMYQLQAEMEGDRHKSDPYFKNIQLVESRNKNVCDPEKTDLGQKNVDYETAEKIYKDQIIKRSERQTLFQKDFDKEILGFIARWKRF